MEELLKQKQQWGIQAMMLYMLAINLANRTPDFYKIKNAGLGDHASNQFMKNLRQLAKDHFGSDFSEKRVCKDTRHAFDFYIPEEGSAIEIALSLRNPLSEYEKDIFKCLLAKEDGLKINSLLFITKPGGMLRHEAAGSKRIRELVLKRFGVWVDILELLPEAEAEKVIEKLKTGIQSVDGTA
jgi:hypothetical protein